MDVTTCHQFGFGFRAISDRTMELYTDNVEFTPDVPGISGAEVFNAAGEVVGILHEGNKLSEGDQLSDVNYFYDRTTTIITDSQQGFVRFIGLASA